MDYSHVWQVEKHASNARTPSSAKMAQRFSGLSAIQSQFLEGLLLLYHDVESTYLSSERLKTYKSTRDFVGTQGVQISHVTRHAS